MIVVVGSRHDRSAVDLVSGWARYKAALLTCEDLSTPGWELRLPDRSGSRAVVSGQIVHEDDFRGVLIRRPCILDTELRHIGASDREFVTAEMNAFLLAWLAGLRCRVLNRPSGTSLCGPGWRPMQWTQAAAAAGLEVAPSTQNVPARRKRTSPRAEAPPPIEVTIVGSLSFGAPNDNYADAALRLSAYVHIPLLAVRFAGGGSTPVFSAATAMPSLRDPAVAQATCEYLTAQSVPA